MVKTIDSFVGEYEFLSNFYMSPVSFFFPYLNKSYEFPAVEHAYQASKTLLEEWIEKIRAAETPGKAKRLGRKCPLRDDWKPLNVMYSLLVIKFTDPVLKKKLLDTGVSLLVEGNHWHDQFWGDCRCPKHKDKQGQNQLGRLLTEIRTDIRLGPL